MNSLPPQFSDWFAARGWSPREHQLAMVAAAERSESALLIAPTGGGKTLAGFLPSLIDLATRPPANTPRGVHTLYISPLKALAVDVERNLMTPIREMGLKITAESRTGDTGAARRQRQRAAPPDILLTTPEQLALFVAWEGSRAYFEDLRCVVLDEAHTLWPSKRGDLLALCLSRLQQYAPAMRRVGLSATVDDPELLRRWMSFKALPLDGGGWGGGASAEPPSAPQEGAGAKQSLPVILVDTPPPPTLPPSRGKGVTLVRGSGGAPPIVEMLLSEGRVPWTGHTAQHAMAEVYDILRDCKTALIFVNTRFQAEFAFQELWKLNEEGFAIALHHGSLAAEQRRRVEAAMARGELKAVVCTSTLDLGIDWGDVDLVIQLAAPKGAARMVQRIGRANHRLDEPSRALFVPANRFEMLECQAAAEAIAENTLDKEYPRTGALDVLAQHIMGCACGEPFEPAALYDEIRQAAPYADLSWEDFETVVDFVSTGGYALRAYDRFRRIVKGRDGLWRARNQETILRHRLNVGAIVAPDTLTVRLNGRRGVPGRKIGEVEEGYLEQLEIGDSFIFAGQVWALAGVTGTDILVEPAPRKSPKMPSWGGSKFAMSAFLADKVRGMIADRDRWRVLPPDVREWLEAQADRSIIPGREDMLLETFEHRGRHFLVCYPFEGRLAHTTLAMLLTKRLERAGRHPMGFVCNDYAMAIWAARSMEDLDPGDLFEEDMLGDDLEDWLADSFMMKRAFKSCAVIAGLIERRFPGQKKSGRQVTFSTDLVYDVLRKHEPGHLLLRCARQDAAQGLIDVERVGAMLGRIRGRIRHSLPGHVTPFAVAIMVEIGKERVAGAAADLALLDAEAELIAEAMG